MGVFEFVVVLVVVTTIGKVVTEWGDRRALPPTGSAATSEIDALRDSVSDLGMRVNQLEEERDFYKELLDAPSDVRSLPAPDSD